MAGGKRTGAGRPRGRKNKATQALEAAARAAVRGLADDFTSLELMQAIYRDDEAPMSARMKAAETALPYEHHRLASIEHTGKDGGALTIQLVRYADDPPA